MSKKVILLIFEGASDKNTIAPYINDLIEECNLSLSVEIMSGDKTSAWKVENGRVLINEFEWTSSNIRKKLIERINNHIKKEASIPALKQKDIYKIYYITDTDDCFQHPERPERFNKSICMKSIFGFNTLELKPKVEVPIDLIFLARDLEHVTINNNKILTMEEKIKLSLEFSKNVYEKNGFFEFTFIKNDLKIWESFGESYKGITSYIGRASNMNILLDEISNFRKLKYKSLIDEIQELDDENTKKYTSILERKLRIKIREKNQLEEIIKKRENILEEYLRKNM